MTDPREANAPPFEAIFTPADAAAFARWAVRTLGPGWHPHNPADDLIRADTGEPSFLPGDARRMDRLRHEAMDTVGVEAFDRLCYDQFVAVGWIRPPDAPDDWRPSFNPHA